MGGTELTDDVGFLLSRASGLLVRVTTAALAVHGLRVRSYSALVLAGQRGDGMSQRELAETMGLDPSQVVLIVDELARAGLVERRPSTSDRRTKLVVATEDGQAVLQAARSTVAGAHDRSLEGLSGADRDLLRGLLARLVGAPGVVAER